MSGFTRCDECRREAHGYDATAGWLHINQRTDEASRSPLGFTSWSDSIGDFCSWKCVSDYATARHLLLEAGQ